MSRGAAQHDRAAHGEQQGQGLGDGSSFEQASHECELRGRQQATAAEHAAALERSFRLSEASAALQWDVWTGVSLAMLLLLALPGSLHPAAWRAQLAAFAAEVACRALPAAMAVAWRDTFLTHRTYIVAACRIASCFIPRLAAPPSAAVAAPAALAAAWPGWRQFLLSSGALSVNTLPWLARLPFKWFAAVHLIGVVSVARATLAAGPCSSPAFTGPPAQQQYTKAAVVARALAMLAPMPSPQPGGTCAEALSAAGGGGGADLGACACRQVAVWLLACLGFAIPMAAQYLVEAAARQRFLRTHCHVPRCEACATGRGADLAMLGATAAMLLASFAGVAWQLAYLAFPAAGVAGAGGGAL